MKGLSELMEQAREMQKNIEAAQQELIAKQVEGIALAGKAKVVINGRYNVIRVELSDDLMNDGKAIVQDAVAAAFNNAAQKIEEFSKTKMSTLMANTKLPTDFGGIE